MEIKLIESIQDVTNLINYVKSNDNGFITNFYINYPRIEYYINLKKLFFIKFKDCVILFRENNLFNNLYFFTKDLNVLSIVLQEIEIHFKNKNLILDIVTKNQNDDVVELFLKKGFNKISILKRMYKLPNVENLTNRKTNSDNIRFANLFDLSSIKNKLDTNFNKEVEQLPDNYELKKLIVDQNVLVHEINNELNGFLIYKKNGKIMNLNYWYVDFQKRDLKIGSQLFERFLIEGQDCLKYQLWVITNNENAIKRYLHYGFQEDYTYNLVLKKHETTLN